MELKLQDFMNEKEKTSVTKKKLGVDISFDKIKAWFKDEKVKGFKSVSGFTKEFNKYFDVEIPSFSQLELSAMVNQGIIIRNGKSVEVGSGETPEEAPEEISISTSTTKVKELSKGKAKKLKIPQGKSESKYQDFLDVVLMNMIGGGQAKLLLTGDPGTGKSRTVENIMSLLRMQVITVEAPHISEEDIINIPYLVRRGNKTAAESSSFKETKTGFEVVQAESALITRLKQKKKITDNEYNAFLKKNKILQPLADEYKETIDEVNDKFATVLFLDEFYRSSSARIQNLFRTILNGKLGNTPIPANVYIIYASNMDNSDGSLDDIPLNHQFDKVNFDTPSKEDFLRYMADRFTNTDVNTGDDEEIETIHNEDGTQETTEVKNPISTEVYNAFVEAFTDDDLGGKDSLTGIRISPRRWEEIMKYINANIPVETMEEARQLMTFLRDNFKDYATEEVSELFKKYEKVLKDIIKETSGFDASDATPLAPSEWRGTLDSQIQTKLKLGDDRKYVPIISGAPGIGKTTIIVEIAKKYNLNQITIDASTLNSDDSTGLTTPSGDGKDLTTEFSEPPLFTQIMNDYDATKLPEGDSKYTHILFIDEISRTSTKVFNSIRSLMLDKKVGALTIPDNIMIIAAMNPTDTGTTELSDHFKDVVDVIDSEANFNEVMAYLEGQKTNIGINEKIGFNITEISIDILKQMVERFESSEDVKGDDIEDHNKRKFFWTDGFNTFYISAREYDSAISGCIIDAYNMIKIKKRFTLEKQYTEEEVLELSNIMEKVMLNKYKQVLSFIAQDKGEMENADFEKIMIGVEDIIGSNMYRITDGFSSVKSEALQSIKSIFEGAKFDVDVLLDYDGIVPIIEKAITDSDTNTFVDDISEILDVYVDYDSVMNSIDNMIGLWKLLAMVDWDQFNGEITALISEMFLERGFKPVLRYARDNETESLMEHGENESLQRYPGLNDVIIQRATANKSNMFVKV